ncbi:MAG: RNA methyltransferase substrate-binding domain-containing protein, partial [Rhodospirillales bacterium]
MLKRPMSKQKPKRTHRKSERQQSPAPAPTNLWIYGIHACVAALNNPDRQINLILTTKHSANFVTNQNNPNLPQHQIVDRNQLDATLPPNSVHQGIAI